MRRKELTGKRHLTVHGCHPYCVEPYCDCVLVVNDLHERRGLYRRYGRQRGHLMGAEDSNNLAARDDSVNGEGVRPPRVDVAPLMNS